MHSDRVGSLYHNVDKNSNSSTLHAPKDSKRNDCDISVEFGNYPESGRFSSDWEYEAESSRNSESTLESGAPRYPICAAVVC